MTDNLLEFSVAGDPVPQGSMKAFVVGGRAVLTSDNKKLKAWRKRLCVLIQAQLLGERISRDTAVGVRISFRLLKPKTVKRVFPTVKPDLDKLVRAVLDAITESGAWADDSQVIELHVRKSYTSTVAGVAVEVFQIPSK